MDVLEASGLEVRMTNVNFYKLIDITKLQK